MDASTVVLVALFALLVGVACGWRLASTVRPPEPPPLEAFPEPVSERPFVEARYIEAARELARRHLPPDAEPGTVESLAAILAPRLADAWSEGVSDLRRALGEFSGLPLDLIEQLCAAALAGLAEAPAAPALLEPRR